MRKFAFSGLLFLAFIVSACTQAGFRAVNLGAGKNSDRVISDVAYGSKPWQKLDIYIPANPQHKKLDVVVFFYGGRWETGAKEDYRFAASAFNSRDFITVIPDYSKYPQVRFPEFVKDGAKALAWVHDNIGAYDGAKTRIHVAGHSAGAHIGALLTADERYLANEGKKRSDVIHDFAGLAGPYSFTPDERDLKDMFGPPSRYPQMQVTSFIDGSEPPMLLMHGANDNTVEMYNLQRLIDSLKKQNGCYKSIIYPGINHVNIVLALSWVSKNKAPVLDDLTHFFNRHPACR